MKTVLPRVMLALFLASCAPSAINPGLRDGMYTGQGDPWEFGYETAVVDIRGGRITDIVLHKYDAEGNEIDYELWDGMSKDGRVYPNLKGARERLAKAIIRKQNCDVDTITGSTISSSQWKTAVRRAIDKAR